MSIITRRSIILGTTALAGVSLLPNLAKAMQEPAGPITHERLDALRKTCEEAYRIGYIAAERNRPWMGRRADAAGPEPIGASDYEISYGIDAYDLRRPDVGEIFAWQFDRLGAAVAYHPRGKLAYNIAESRVDYWRNVSGVPPMGMDQVDDVTLRRLNEAITVTDLVERWKRWGEARCEVRFTVKIRAAITIRA